MKLDTLLTAAWLASTATAIGPANPDSPPRLKGAPAKMAAWRFPNPFASPRHKLFTPSCSATGTIKAKQYLLDDLALEPPEGLLPYREALRQVFSAREYPGSWEGIDPHGYDRILLSMEYDDVPIRVREWIEQQERTDGKGKGLFAVYGKPQKEGSRVLNTINVPRETPVPGEWRERDANRIVVFAPGALYEILPLFVATGSDCEETLLDLSKYSGELADGGVVAYPVEHTKPSRNKHLRDIEITIKAEVLKQTEEEKAEEKVEEKKAEEAEKEEKKEETKAAEKDEL